MFFTESLKARYSCPGRLFVYEAIKGELNGRPMYDYWCDERLKANKAEGSLFIMNVVYYESIR
jgi:hypothetical protein